MVPLRLGHTLYGPRLPGRASTTGWPNPERVRKATRQAALVASTAVTSPGFAAAELRTAPACAASCLPGATTDRRGNPVGTGAGLLLRRDHG